jgi:hypothetical protein
MKLCKEKPKLTTDRIAICRRIFKTYIFTCPCKIIDPARDRVSARNDGIRYPNRKGLEGLRYEICNQGVIHDFSRGVHHRKQPIHCDSFQKWARSLDGYCVDVVLGPLNIPTRSCDIQRSDG